MAASIALSRFAAATSVVLATMVHGAEAVKAEPAPPAPGPFVPVRVIDEPGKRIALEVATVDLRPAGDAGPVVSLVGVAHIADRSFFKQIQNLLESYDVVLYEAVMPAGAAGAGGETAAERVASTEAAMGFVAGLLERHRAVNDGYPESLAALVSFAGEIDGRLGDWLETATLDAWGRPLEYRSVEGSGRFELRSLGADGAAGGEGPASDLVVSTDDGVIPLDLGSDVNLQAELASALGLVFQLEALDYDRDEWRCSDLAMDQLERQLAERGLDFAPLGSALGGTSLPSRIAAVLLRAIRVLDAFVDGAIADTAKVMLIEMIGDPLVVEQGLREFGEGFAEVIIGDRNQVAVDDVKGIAGEEPAVERIAVLYGAAHLPDLMERLQDQLGYERGEEHWYRVIDVDLTTTAVDARYLNQMRMMMRQAMRQQFGGR